VGLANCSRCGGLFSKISRDYCTKCYEEEEELLRSAQEFLRNNREAGVHDLIDELELEQWMVEKWVNEKRINLLKEEELHNKRYCTECGRELKSETGTVCKTCQFKKVMKKKSETDSASSTQKKTDDSGAKHHSGISMRKIGD